VKFGRLALLVPLLLGPAAQGHLTRGGGPHASAGEEFVGPFANWINAQTGKRADGSGSSLCTGGTTDVTLQTCINALSTANPKLWLPAGTYTIANTLNVSSNVTGICTAPGSGACEYMGIIGHDPVDTILRWTGAAHGTILHLNGMAVSQFNRMTFDGGGTADYLVDDSWDQLACDAVLTTQCGKTFNTGNQYTDDVFQNGSATSIGYRCGGQVPGAAPPNGCSETEIIRSTFSGLSFGVATCNSNSLDVWVGYSRFINNAYGVSNNPANIFDAGCAGGNYHVMSSIFQGSTAGDIWSNHGGAFNIIDNYSSGSYQFIPSHGGTLTLQRNTILNTTISPSIAACFNVALLDNAILTKVGNSAPVVTASAPACGGGRLVSIGNTFTVSSAEVNYDQNYVTADVVDPTGASINQTMPTLPPTPPNNNRTIYEATPSGSGTTCSAASPCSIQQAITNASNAEASGSVHPVAHIQGGLYTVASTINVPATVKSGIQIIGDSSLSWLTGNSGVNPVLKLNGPSQVTLRDIQMHSASGNDAILIAGADQVGAIIYLTDNLIEANLHSLFLDALSNVLVEAHDFNFPYNTAQSVLQTGPSQLNVFLGATSGSGLSNLSGGARSNMVGVWEDQNAVAAGISATGSGTFNFSTSSFATNAGIDTADMNNFSGTAVIFNLQVPTIGAINTTGTGNGSKVIVSLIKLTTSPFFTDGATGDTVEVFGNEFQPNIPSSPDMTVVATAMQSLRTIKPNLPATYSPGTTYVQMYKMNVVAPGANGLHVTQ
jgi:hypothetical protein